MLPSSAELKYFIEVVNTLNLSRASERLGISQPSLSLAIKRLEESSGATLLIRHKHGVSLTQPGKQLFLHARQLLQYWETTRARTLASQEEVQGHFTIGCPSTIGIHIISAFLGNLLEQHPKLSINLKHDSSRKIVENIISLSIDIGIVVNPIKHPDLILKKLSTDEVGFWVGHGNRKIQNIHSEETVILCNPDMMQTQPLLKKAKRAGFNTGRIITVNSLEVIASLTAAGSGIGILPTCVAHSTQPGKLKTIAKMPIYLDEIFLAYRNENRAIKAIQTITDLIKTQYKQEIHSLKKKGTAGFV